MSESLPVVIALVYLSVMATVAVLILNNIDRILSEAFEPESEASAQKREPDAWMRKVDAESFRTGSPHYGSNAPMFKTIPDDMKADAVPVYLGQSERSKCMWKESSDGVWETGCNQAFVLEDGDPDDNGMKFCCYCGRVLEAEPYIWEDDDDT